MSATGLLGVMCILVTCTSCHPAAVMERGNLVAERRFAFAGPDEETWRLAVNRTFGGVTRVVYRHRGGDAWIGITSRRESAATRDIPLDVLAVAVFGRSHGAREGPVHMEAMHRIALDDRECIAILATRHDRPNSWREAFLLLRSQGHLMTLTFGALEPVFPEREVAFERVVRSFKVLLPGSFDRWRLGDIPVGPPGRAPRNIYAPRSTPAPLVRSREPGF